MSEKIKREKKGKNFKEFIEEEKHKGQTVKKVMRILTGIDSSAMYGGSFLLAFVPIIALIYILLTPSVFIWAGALIVVAVLASVFANYVTKTLKKKQWMYASR